MGDGVETIGFIQYSQQKNQYSSINIFEEKIPPKQEILIDAQVADLLDTAMNAAPVGVLERALQFTFLEQIMRKIQAITSVAILSVAGSVFAGDLATSEYVDNSGFVSTKTRSQVRGELEQARSEGLMNQQSEYVQFEQSNIGPRGPAGSRTSTAEMSGKTRVQVRSELEEAYAKGLLAGQKEYEGN